MAEGSAKGRMMTHGRQLMLQALAGQPTEHTPVTLLTWGYDYIWRVAGLVPWQLACGSSRTWHAAHLALLERHGPDAIIYSGAGSGPLEPTLLADEKDRWIVRDNNTGVVQGLTKSSLALHDPAEGRRSADPGQRIATIEDADRLVRPYRPDETFLNGLQALIREVGERALVLPTWITGYIAGCYAFGFEAAMTAMVENPELFFHVCDLCASGDAPFMLELAKAGAEAVFIADSWASCDIISPAFFKRYALPYQAAATEAAQAAGLRAIVWNLGDIGPVLDLEAGLSVDGFAFEQPRKAFTISVSQVREAFGPTRCLFGNLDSEALLLRNNAQEIAQAVREQVRQSGPGAPFVMCTGSPIPSDVEPEAVDAMIVATRAV